MKLIIGNIKSFKRNETQRFITPIHIENANDYLVSIGVFFTKTYYSFNYFPLKKIRKVCKIIFISKNNDIFLTYSESNQAFEATSCCLFI